MLSPSDLAFVRSHFPALDGEWALFDNAGGSVPLRSAIERVAGYMTRGSVQHGGAYELSAEASRQFHEGHAAAARLVGADEDEVFLGASTTACLRLLARALRPMFRPGDEVVVTDLDHESNIGPWLEFAEDGVVVREWAMDRDNAELTAAGLDAVLTPRTRLVAFTHVSNIVGTVHDATALVKRIHAAGALACVDGVAFAPHRRVDVRAIGADFYAVSLYKVFGPHLGMIYGKRDLLRRARPQNHFFIPADAVPYKFEPGSVPHELVAALPAIPGYIDALAARLGDAWKAILLHEAALAAPLLDFLQSRRGVRVLGRPGADRVPTLAFAVEGRESWGVAEAVARARVAIKSGDLYAARAVDALGLRPCGGVVRASLLHYNTPEEVTRLVRALDTVLA